MNKGGRFFFKRWISGEDSGALVKSVSSSKGDHAKAEVVDFTTCRGMRRAEAPGYSQP